MVLLQLLCQRRIETTIREATRYINSSINCIPDRAANKIIKNVPIPTATIIAFVFPIFSAIGSTDQIDSRKITGQAPTIVPIALAIRNISVLLS